MKFSRILAVVAFAFLIVSCGDKTKLAFVPLQDNSEPRLMSWGLFGDVPEEIRQEIDSPDGLPSSVSCFLLRLNDDLVLFDTGNGNDDSRLMIDLKERNVDAEDIDYVFLTHLHGDHIGGLVREDTAVFCNAKLYLAKQEYDWWMEKGEEGSAQQKRILSYYEDDLVLFDYNDTLPCEIIAINTEGHTGGHTVYQFNNVLIIGDLIHGADLQIKYPEYCASFDADKEKAIKNRKKMLEYAQMNNMIMAGMHLPDKGIIDYSE